MNLCSSRLLSLTYFSPPKNRSKVKSSSRPRNDSLATIKLEDLFGAISFGGRDSPIKYSYPNTVPQAKVSTFKNMGLTDSDAHDDVEPKPLAFTSASIAANRRRSHEFGMNQL